MKKIGCGTYGDVFYDSKTNEAVKKCYHEDSREIWIGNIREMDILKRCGDHPNIVTLNRVEINPNKTKKHNKLILRLKYYPTNLHDFMTKTQNGRLDIATARIITAQILVGLEYLHVNKIIHRDLKPDNILLNPETMEVALCDFGMSEILMKYKTGDPKVTAPMYRAPEVFKERYYSSEIDLWAVGLILYTMIYGESPYNYPTDKEKTILEKIEKLSSNLEAFEEQSEKESEIKSIERDIKSLKDEITDLVLKEISKIDLKKTFNRSNFGFKKLLIGLLQENPNKRLTATQALNDPFFDTVRAKYIDSVRSQWEPIPDKQKKLNIEGIPERAFINKYTMKYISENEDYDYYPIVFHGLDIFEKYLNNCREKRLVNASGSVGKYLSEKEVDLYLHTCFYIAHKFYSITEIPLDYEDFFPEDLRTGDNMVRAEEFEHYMITEVLGFRFFDYTLYEIAEEMINDPQDDDYHKILKEYLMITHKTQHYNSYRSLYRECLMQKMVMN